MKEYKTEKLYFGFPVFVVSMKNNSEETLMTTISSSYSLRDLLVVGMSKISHTAVEIEVGSKLAFSYLRDDQGLLSDICGWVATRDKAETMAEAGFTFSEFEGIPYLSDCLVTIIGRVTQIVEMEYDFHYFIEIEDRLINEDYLDEKGRFQYSAYNPMIYLGDGKRRVYKKTGTDIVPSAAYLKEYKKAQRKQRGDI
ncbi:flavin reductase [Floricoccus penangensis]|uniref:flavin reductase n=1 Tax=Floricoccus penangensis TaxID=1859475 RepID=UPI00204242B7|nr:flavin reductase [Floricoccus penangensis]URZ86903.1 flavin reductase [Floricoccus penangensis]